MKKIPGKLITQTIEVGAEYQAEDGAMFSNQWDCEKYEAKIAKEKKEQHLKEVVSEILKNELILECGDCEKQYYIKKFETKEDFLDAVKTLDTDTQGMSRYSFVEGYNLSERKLPEFPATYIIEYRLTEYADSFCDSETFNLCEANGFIKKLQEDIDTIKKNM